MSDYLPKDVLIDVLARLPTETLIRLTSVSKSWRSLITSPKFISHHCCRNAYHGLRLVRHRTDDPNTDHYSLTLDGNDSFIHLKSLDSPFNSVGHSIVGSVNGVICLSHDLEYGYIDDMFLWNPSIRKSVALPKYNVRFRSHGPFMHCLGFGYDPVANDFKVIRVVHTGWCTDRIPPLVELYTHRTGRWRDISERALPLMIEERCRQAYVNGAANWMASTPETESTDFRDMILSFNMSDEVFNEILLPGSLAKDCSMERMILVVLKDSLCLIQQCVYSNDPHCSVWIMKEYGVAASWANLFRIDLSGGLRRPLGFRENGEVIFATCDGDLVSCDHQSRRITHLGVRGTFGDGYSYWHTFYTDTYTESLELLGKLETEITVVSGQKKSNNAEEEAKQMEAESLELPSKLESPEDTVDNSAEDEEKRKEAGTFAEFLVMLNKWASLENTVVSRQKKSNSPEDEEKQMEAVHACNIVSWLSYYSQWHLRFCKFPVYDQWQACILLSFKLVYQPAAKSDSYLVVHGYC